MGGLGFDTGVLVGWVRSELAEAAPFDWLCVGVTDPSTGLVTMVQDCTPIGPPEVYLAAELFVPDVNKIAWLAEQPVPVGVLSEATGGDLESSYRYRNALRPSGIGHELRAALVVDGRCWGYMVLLRKPERPDFSGDEVRAVAAAVPRLAGRLRDRLLRATAAGAGTGPGGHGYAVVAEDGSLEGANDRAAEVFARISAQHPAVQLDLPVPVAVMVAALQAPGAPETRRALVSVADAGWLVLEAGRVPCGDGGSRVVVSIEPARPVLLAPLLLQAAGLTEREIEVARCVLYGMTNAEIADRLGISPYTVQDHLKAAFAKTGTRSRRELANEILPGTHFADIP
ncbi:MAG: LuxR C-terminal-related transcriptional regulator [Mycobacteriales bacterium]